MADNFIMFLLKGDLGFQGVGSCHSSLTQGLTQEQTGVKLVWMDLVSLLEKKK